MNDRLKTIPVIKILKSFSILCILCLIQTGCESINQEDKKNTKSYSNLRDNLISASKEGYDRFKDQLITDITNNPDCLQDVAFIIVSPESNFGIDYVKKMAEDESPIIRSLGARVISLKGDPAYLPLLFNYLDTDNSDIFKIATESIAFMNLPEGCKRLTDLIISEKTPLEKKMITIEALGLSSCKQSVSPLLKYIIDEWNNKYFTDEFILLVETVKRLKPTADELDKLLKNDKGKSEKSLMIIGLLGEADRLDYMLKHEIDFFKEYSSRKEYCKRIMQLLSIQTDRNIVNLLYSWRGKAINEKNEEIENLLITTIKDSFKFHAYLIIHGKDDTRLEAMKSFLLFGLRDYHNESLEILKELQRQKIRNSFVSNEMIRLMGALRIEAKDE